MDSERSSDRKQDEPRVSAPESVADAPIIQTPPEFAFADEEARGVISGEIIAGTSLWRDAWRRLLRNKLAVFGIIAVIIVALASFVGPTLIKSSTGYSYDFIPRDASLTKSFAPLRGPDGRFSWAHPMGTDNAGRDIMARVLSGGQISLMVALISTLVSLLIGVSYGALAGYIGGRLDDLLMRIVDVLFSPPHVIIFLMVLVFLPPKKPTCPLAEMFF